MTPAAQAAISFVLTQEGGLVDDPDDPGGATNMGITIAVLGEWRGKPATKGDVHALTRDEASAIYVHRYWMPIRGDDLPAGAGLVTMDAAVNSGVKRAARWLQQSLGILVDESIGPMTIAAAHQADQLKLVQDCCQHRIDFLRTLKTYPKFGRGWEARVHRVEAAAEQLAQS